MTTVSTNSLIVTTGVKDGLTTVEVKNAVHKAQLNEEKECLRYEISRTFTIQSKLANARLYLVRSVLLVTYK